MIQPKKRPGVKTVSLGTEKAIEKIPLVDAPIFRLHGDLSQVERNTATNKFRSEKTAVMIATDVAARGLDFPDLDWIIQFDPPTDTKVPLFLSFPRHSFLMVLLSSYLLVNNNVMFRITFTEQGEQHVWAERVSRSCTSPPRNENTSPTCRALA